ncbi:sensor histidine kinase [Roseibium aggregatum]|uniref:histidine kinase n=1 Tax=Roseibium aggregatum TaxID=187304 RepID=A0A926S699_9HYPH|nr:HAMP domain-containing sensor histidine kinase [Roseibium aggregatum]MBD1546262.1 HAMP domain-containing histidine kinase [Roseibium aggregatum]
MSLAIFLVAATLAATAAFLVIRQELEKRHAVHADQEFRLMAQVYEKEGLTGLAETINTHIDATAGRDKVYRLEDASGRSLAGNFSVSASLPSSGEVSSARLGFDDDFTYFIRSGTLGDLKLAVGISAEDVSEVEEVFIDGVMWGSLLLAAISIAGSFALSMQSDRRIAGIESALQQVNDGHLDVRIPKSGKDDDIDRIATMIDKTIAALGANVETNRQISSDIAHDLKTPLNRVRIDIESAIELQQKNQPVIAELEAIEGEVGNILSTFDALLRIAQIESGARKERFESLDLAKVIEPMAEFYSAYADECGAVLECKIQDGLPPIQGDKELLTQLLANLFENAFKHGGEGLKLECQTRVTEHAVVVEICDNGPGIPAEERENVLRRLYRLDKSRSKPGSGLGLSMVKAISDLHDAKLSLGDHHPGLTVKIEFPTT